MRGAELKDYVLDKVDDLKAKDIIALDVKEKSTITEYMIICSGTSKTHVKSIAEYVALETKNAGFPPIGIEGRDGSEWVLVDLGDVILHVMQDHTRDFYQLEKLWSDNHA